MKILVVVDMQNDFIDGSLGTPQAQAIVPKVCEKIKQYRENSDEIIYTRDTHFDDYLETQEGQKLPIRHCISGTLGWEICKEIQDIKNIDFASVEHICDKYAFGSFGIEQIVEFFLTRCLYREEDLELELVGLCTDVCVISNAIILKNQFPELPIIVDATCCAGTTPENHENALKAMECCQIEVRR